MVLNGTNRGSIYAVTAYSTERNDETKQNLEQIRGIFTNLCPTNKEGDKVDTFQMGFGVAEVSGK